MHRLSSTGVAAARQNAWALSTPEDNHQRHEADVGNIQRVMAHGGILLVLKADVASSHIQHRRAQHTHAVQQRSEQHRGHVDQGAGAYLALARLAASTGTNAWLKALRQNRR